MRSYGQYCPVSRAAELLGERWTIIVIRNLIMGCHTFTEIAAGAPGMSRSLLSKRLDELASAGVIEGRENPGGRGTYWELTEMGQELVTVIEAVGMWGARWLELLPVHTHPGVVLWSWCTDYVAHEALPDDRVVVRFEFPDQPADRRRYWLLAEREDVELCTKPPGPDEHVVVRSDGETLARWHLGELTWEQAIRGGTLEVDGPQDLARAVPRWNRKSRFAGASVSRAVQKAN